MSAHFASVLVPESKIPDVLAVADLATAALQDLIATADEDSPDVANLQAAIDSIRHAVKTHAAAQHPPRSAAALDRAQFALVINAAARRATSFDARAAVMVAESCL